MIKNSQKFIAPRDPDESDITTTMQYIWNNIQTGKYFKLTWKELCPINHLKLYLSNGREIWIADDVRVGIDFIKGKEIIKFEVLEG